MDNYHISVTHSSVSFVDPNDDMWKDPNIPKKSYNIVKPYSRDNPTQYLYVKWMVDYGSYADPEEGETVTFYFVECSSEFIFGFSAAIANIYTSLSRGYGKTYYELLGRIQNTRQRKITLKYRRRGTIVTIAHDDVTIWMVTTDLDDFSEGWCEGKVINDMLSIDKYYEDDVPISVSNLTVRDLMNQLKDRGLTNMKRKTK